MIRVTIKDNKAYIETPYNKLFIEKVKGLGGKWDSYEKVWVIDSRNIEAARKIMKEVYGRDDKPTKTVSVRVFLGETLYGRCGPVTLFGKIIAGAWGRDTGAKVGEGVAFEQGLPKSGGSVKNWTTVVPEKSTIVIHGVPLESVESKFDWKDGYGVFEVINPKEDERQALLREKEVLEKRLKEVNSLLLSWR